ncbi:Hypothetical protein TFLO_2285 [Trichococcus flocculiformis]|uniref:Uncharacterized protein n=1 Tax=Trichococcus flocculiformis TaxID=82803 RepID=A0ABM9WGL6_9LACT|nr:Hypothetical protein TFLO_2285 [Trichococcus flocculiformis]
MKAHSGRQLYTKIETAIHRGSQCLIVNGNGTKKDLKNGYRWIILTKTENSCFL